MTDPLVLLAKAEHQSAALQATLAALRQALVGGPPCSQDTLRGLAGFLLSFRDTHGLSRVVLARKLDVSITTLKNLERAKHWPHTATLAALLQWPDLPEDLRSALRPHVEATL